MQMSFNMFNFRTRMALSRVPPWIPSPPPFSSINIHSTDPSTMFLSTTDLSYLMLEGSWCPRL